MGKTGTDKNLKTCRRCGKKLSRDIICASCKNELLSAYENNLDWQTAYEVEKAHRMVLRYRLREDM